MIEIIKNLIEERTFISPKDGMRKTRYGYRGKSKIEWIVIHYAGSPSTQGKGRWLSNRMKTWKETKSTHYIVGEDGVFQAVKDEHSAWHCGGYCSENKCVACNAVSLGVDLMECKVNRKSDSVADSDWFFTKEVIEKGAELVAMLAEKYGIPDDHIIRHFDITGKRCPRPFVGTDTNSVTGETGEFLWMTFKLLVDAKRRMINKDYDTCMCSRS